MASKKYDYDIVLSFAGENREIAEDIADKLSAHGVDAFYDKNVEDELWGKDLYEYLYEIYSERGRYCLMLISEHYARKAWTNHERKSAQERSFRKNEEYILPVRLDDTKIPGIRDTVGYLDYSEKGVDGIVKATLNKLGRNLSVESDKDRGKYEPISFSPRMPDVKKQFSDIDRENFLYESFAYITRYIEDGLQKLEQKHPDIEINFREIHDSKIIAKLYKNGNQVHAFKLWIGSQMSMETICFKEGNRVYIEEDNSFHEVIFVEEKDNELKLKATLGIIGRGMDREIGSEEDMAAYLWDRIINPLEI